VVAEPLHPATTLARASEVEHATIHTPSFMRAAYAACPPSLPANLYADLGSVYSPSMGDGTGRMTPVGLLCFGSQRATCAPDRSMMRSHPRMRMNW
jgi:hypothetical protein